MNHDTLHHTGLAFGIPAVAMAAVDQSPSLWVGLISVVLAIPSVLKLVQQLLDSLPETIRKCRAALRDDPPPPPAPPADTKWTPTAPG